MDALFAASSAAIPEWGTFVPGATVASVTELAPGDLVLGRCRKPGFHGPCYQVMEITGGDSSGNNHSLVFGRLVEPSLPLRSRDGCTGRVVLWDFYLTEGRVQLFRAKMRRDALTTPVTEPLSWGESS